MNITHTTAINFAKAISSGVENLLLIVDLLHLRTNTIWECPIFQSSKIIKTLHSTMHKINVLPAIIPFM